MELPVKAEVVWGMLQNRIINFETLWFPVTEDLCLGLAYLSPTLSA